MIKTPGTGERVAPFMRSSETLDLLLTRRSTTAALLSPPGPSAEELETMLAAAARVPDHRRVNPFRFVLFEGPARKAAGAALADAFKSANPDADDKAVAFEAARFERAPVVVLVVASLDTAHKTPLWEQTLTVGAACQNLLIAASASGYAAQWLTEWYAYDRQVLNAFGLGDEETAAGFIYIGTATEDPKERPRQALAETVSRFGV